MRKHRILSVFVMASIGGCGTILGLDDYTDTSTQPPVCAPNETQECAYNGPETALAYDPCKRGTQACNADGRGFGECQGEVLPASQEDCSNDVDDDCNGTVNDTCLCVPGVSESCYTGPMGTADVGQCVSGEHTCAADGKSFSACVNDVLPGVEDCANMTDEDCNGTYCTQCLWSYTWGDMATQTTSAIAVDAAGNIIIAGSFHGALNIGNVSLSSAGGADVVVAKLDQDGNVLWAKQFGLANDSYTAGLALDSMDNIVVVGHFLGSISFDNNMTTLTATSAEAFDEDMFVAKLDTNGNHLWSKRFGDANDQNVSAVAIDGNDNVILTGSYEGTVNFNPGTITAATGVGNYDAFVAKLNSSGTGVWAKTYGDAPAGQYGIGVVADAAGNITFVSSLRGTITFGGAYTYTGSAAGDYVIGRLDATGTHVWSRWASAGGSNITVGGIVRDSAGSIVLGGAFGGTLNFEPGLGNPTTLVEPGTGQNLFVVKYTSSGVVTWATQAGAASAPNDKQKAVYSVVTDANNDIFIMGGCYGAFDMGFPEIVGCGVNSYAPYLAKLTSGGAPVWGRGFGVDSGSIIDAVYVSPAKLFVLGNNTKFMNLGTGPMLSAGNNDIAVGLIVPE